MIKIDRKQRRFLPVPGKVLSKKTKKETEVNKTKMKLNNLKKKMWFCLIVALFLFQYSFATTYYVSTTGNDASGDGNASNPWKTLMYAVTKVAANQGHTIQVGAGTFVESGLVEVPLGVSITGAGIDMTIFKAASSFYYHPADPGYATDKFLISLS